MIKRLLSRNAGTALLMAGCGWTTVCAAADFDAIVSRSVATGGLCVQLGGGDGTGTLRLAGEGRTLVHRLETDGDRLAQVRRLIASAGLYGQVSAEPWSSTQLPYIDNLVNMIVVDDALGVSDEEFLRVLCPRGVAYLRNGIEYREIHKPRPPEMGEWTHPWHGANGNLVSEDTYLDVPNGVQWIAGPLFPMDARKSSAQGLVTANGRLFNITQNELQNLSNVAQNPPNFLVARDAFNGLRLWSRPWTGPVIGGTANVSIIAHGDHVYGLDGDQLVVLDAATGHLLKSLAAPADPYKILYTDGRLTVESRDGLSAVDTKSGMIAWRFPASEPYGTVVDDGRVFCIVGTREKNGRWLHEILCLDLQTGKEQWRKTTESRHALQKSSALRIQFATNGILCVIDRRIVRVYAAQDGRVLWTKTSPAEGRGGWDTRLVGHFFGQGLLWMRQNDAERKLASQEVWHGLDPMTGEVQRELKTSGNWPQTGAPAKMGCQPLMATDRFIMFPRQATCVDFTSGEKGSFKFARGGCVVGAVPANGLAYVTPHACGCFSETLRGFISVRSGMPQDAPDDDVSFEKGPAFDAEIDALSGPADAQWPIYRHDPLRSGSTPNKVAPRLKLRWSATIDQSVDTLSDQEWKLRVGNRVTSSVIASGTAYVAVPNSHRVVAVNAETGSELWQFTAGGRIDTPPTIHEGLCLFGAHDGWVYCLDAIDGTLIWRRRAAPTSQRMIAFGQLESIAPLAGTVLIHDGQAYIAAGRAPDADGGIRVMALEPRTGRVIWDETISDAYFGLCDYLVSNGKQVYLSNWEFDAKTGKNRRAEESKQWLQGGKVGLLEASWTHIEMALRKHIQEWTYAETAGQLLAFSAGQIFGFKWTEDGSSRTLPAVLFAAGKHDWNLELRDPHQIESLILTPDILFVAGPKDRRNPHEGGILSSVAPDNGQIISETTLTAPPVFDGLAAADGHLFVTTQDGKLLCYEGADTTD